MHELQTTARGAGGTPGGIGEFLLGLAMAVGGGYLITTRVIVTSTFWTFWGYNGFGLSLLPLLAGIGILFFNGRSLVGWLLLLAGAVIIGAGILMSLSIYFQPTSLFNSLLMMGLLAGGIGLIARAVQAH